MPWRDPRSIRFTRIGVVSEVPPTSGVYAIFDREKCLLVGDSWNLRARLLELANIDGATDTLSVTFESCAEDEAASARAALERELIAEQEALQPSSGSFPGISFWTDPPRSNA